MNQLDQAVPLSEAAKRWLPPSRTGKPVHPSVLTRWSVIGISVGGHRVRMFTTRIGGQRYVTHADLQAFLDALNAEPEGEFVRAPDDNSPRDVPPNRARVQQAKSAAMALLK